MTEHDMRPYSAAMVHGRLAAEKTTEKADP